MKEEEFSHPRFVLWLNTTSLVGVFVILLFLAVQLRYSTEDCSFEEEIRPDGYNVYKSKKHGISVSLSSAKQRQQFKGKDFLPLSHFLPMINTVPVESADFGEYGDYSQAFEAEVFSLPLETDSMDPFGITSKLSPVKSPSFQK